MAHELSESTAVLEFEQGHPLHGSTVRVSLDMSLGERFELQRKMLARDNGDDSLDEALTRKFAQYLIDWDIVWRGAPVSPDYDGLLELPAQIADAMIMAWAQARTGVPLASDGRTRDGG